MIGKSSNLKKASVLTLLFALALVSIQLYSKKVKHNKSFIYANLTNLKYYEFNDGGEYSKIANVKKVIKEKNDYSAEYIDITAMENKNTQKLSAEQAKLDNKNNIINLKNNITIKEKIDKKETTIKTNTLTVDIAKKYAFNNAETTLINEQGTVNSIGIKIDLISRTFDLLKSISGAFIPNTPKNK